MCRPQIVPPKLHPLLKDFPNITSTQCCVLISYINSFTHTFYCTKCHDLHELWHQPDRYKFKVNHAFIDGVVDDIKCELCKTNLYKTRSIMNCAECFINYLDVVGKLRRRGYPVENIGFLAYDNIKTRIIHLSIILRRDPTTIADMLADHLQRLTIG